MSSNKEIYAHKKLSFRSDSIHVNGTPITEGVYVQLLPHRDITTATGFQALKSISTTATLLDGTGAEIGLAAPNFNDAGSAVFTKTFGQWAFSSATGRLTCSTPGDYKVDWTCTLSRPAGATAETYQVGIGVDGVSPILPVGSLPGAKEIYSSGPLVAIDEAITLSGTCVHTLQTGQTLSLFAHHVTPAAGAQSIDLDIWGASMAVIAFLHIK
jgi:hypothetical protein